VISSLSLPANHYDDTGPPGIYAVQVNNDFQCQGDVYTFQNNLEAETNLTEGRITIPGSDLTKFPNQGSAIIDCLLQNYEAELTGTVIYTEFNLPIKDQWVPESYRPPTKVMA